MHGEQIPHIVVLLFMSIQDKGELSSSESDKNGIGFIGIASAFHGSNRRLIIYSAFYEDITLSRCSSTSSASGV